MDKISLNRLNGFKCVQEALRTDLKVNCIFFKQNYSTRNHKSDTSPVKNVVLLHWKTKCLQRPQSQETDAGRTRAIQQGNIWQAGDTVPGTLRDTKGGHCVPVVFPSFLSFLVFLSLFIHFFFVIRCSRGHPESVSLNLGVLALLPRNAVYYGW